MPIARVESIKRAVRVAAERVHSTALSVFDADKLEADMQEKGYTMLPCRSRVMLCVEYLPADAVSLMPSAIALGEIRLRKDTRATVGLTTGSYAALRLYSPYKVTLERDIEQLGQRNGGCFDESALDDTTKARLTVERDNLARDEKVLAGDILTDKERAALVSRGINPQTVTRASLLAKIN
jgi:hypothetical protein